MKESLLPACQLIFPCSGLLLFGEITSEGGFVPLHAVRYRNVSEFVCWLISFSPESAVWLRLRLALNLSLRPFSRSLLRTESTSSQQHDSAAMFESLPVVLAFLQRSETLIVYVCLVLRGWSHAVIVSKECVTVLTNARQLARLILAVRLNASTCNLTVISAYQYLKQL